MLLAGRIRVIVVRLARVIPSALTPQIQTSDRAEVVPMNGPSAQVTRVTLPHVAPGEKGRVVLSCDKAARQVNRIGGGFFRSQASGKRHRLVDGALGIEFGGHVGPADKMHATAGRHERFGKARAVAPCRRM
jgi:hypothetical protein